jgi:16S rRNA (guanine527-N7)-methyltransferase
MGEILETCGIHLTRIQLDALWGYHQLLREHNPILNLTRIHNFSNMVLKLYADSILPAALTRLPSPLLDLGTGPGMPGIPLKIYQTDLEILLAESRQNRVDFLNLVVQRLELTGAGVIGRGISPSFETPVQGVITRAVEPIPDTLERISGCLETGGRAIFMKGPNCDAEIEETLQQFKTSYRLVQDLSYNIGKTPHKRRLIIFERTDRPGRVIKEKAMKQHEYRKIESDTNPLFKELKKLDSGRGIKKLQKALIHGGKQVLDALRIFPDQCEAWITRDETPPPENSPGHLSWIHLPPDLFNILDLFGIGQPLLLISVPGIPPWTAADGFEEGCALLVPFQDPENVGTVIRSAVALGVGEIILLAESAHPYHPKSIRASAGAVFSARLRTGPSINDLPDHLPIVPLSSEGSDIAGFPFPKAFGLLPGVEGPGLPAQWREKAAAIPISHDVESLNAATAAAIAMYAWKISCG